MKAVRIANNPPRRIGSISNMSDIADPANAACAIVNAIVLSFILPQIAPVDPQRDPATAPAMSELSRRPEIVRDHPHYPALLHPYGEIASRRSK